jgi:hypothetical protein
MTVTYHADMVQGSDEWHEIRCGMLTASNMSLILTPTLKMAANDKERAHLYELLAQRATNYVEPHYVGDDMLRGKDEEYDARLLYSEKYEPVTECGFITNDKLGFPIGCSPDGIVGDDGLIEAKSRRQKHQAQTIIEGKCPQEFMLQVQSGLLISERKWCDFISYCGGMPMFVCRVFPDEAIQTAIINAAIAFEARLQDNMEAYILASERLHPTERKIQQEIIAS